MSKQTSKNYNIHQILHWVTAEIQQQGLGCILYGILTQKPSEKEQEVHPLHSTGRPFPSLKEAAEANVSFLAEEFKMQGKFCLLSDLEKTPHPYPRFSIL